MKFYQNTQRLRIHRDDLSCHVYNNVGSTLVGKNLNDGKCDGELKPVYIIESKETLYFRNISLKTQMNLKSYY